MISEKKYIILDLDNTIYPVSSIGDELFRSLFKMLERSGEFEGDIDYIKNDIMRKPFQVVARTYKFSEALTNAGIEHLKSIEYTGPIQPFDDYALIQGTPQKKFLVTTGFSKLQESKIKGMKIGNDFVEIRIVDPMVSTRTKKDEFLSLMDKYSIDKKDLLVIGDDPASELKAAKEIGVDAVLYDKLELHPGSEFPRILDYRELTVGG